MKVEYLKRKILKMCTLWKRDGYTIEDPSQIPIETATKFIESIRTGCVWHLQLIYSLGDQRPQTVAISIAQHEWHFLQIVLQLPIRCRTRISMKSHCPESLNPFEMISFNGNLYLTRIRKRCRFWLPWSIIHQRLSSGSVLTQ